MHNSTHRRLISLALLVLLSSLACLPGSTSLQAAPLSAPVPEAITTLQGRNCRSTKLASVSSETPLALNLLFSTQTFTETEAPVTQDAPSMVSSVQGQLAVVWVGYTRKGANVFFSRSTDNGATWKRRVRVNGSRNSADQQAMPSLGMGPDGSLYVVWVDGRHGQPQILFARSTNQGRTWSINVRVSSLDTLTPETVLAPQYAPSLAVGKNGMIYVAWEDYKTAPPTIVVARSADQGRTWRSTRLIDDDADDAAESPTLAVGNDGVVYCVWCQVEEEMSSIAFARSVNNGERWSNHVLINDGAAAAESPTLAVGPDNQVYVAWQDYRNEDGDIFMTSSTNRGETWQTNTRVNDDSARADQSLPSLRVGAITNTIYLAWRDERTGDATIYFAGSNNGGRNWDANVQVSDGPAPVERDMPSLVVGTNHRLALAWADRRMGNASIYFSTSDNNGQTWQPNAPVTTEQFNLFLPITQR